MTKTQRRRALILKQEVGCLACGLDGHDRVPADLHHFLSGGRRISHSHSVPLCKLHHTGAEGIHTRKHWFADEYGTDIYLLTLADTAWQAFEDNTIGRCL